MNKTGGWNPRSLAFFPRIGGENFRPVVYSVNIYRSAHHWTCCKGLFFYLCVFVATHYYITMEETRKYVYIGTLSLIVWLAHA
jgi:hypothetical protein